ncbi:hypothetical protein T440DRAFT_520932 [Plenodomus tracheiphilus IPT5]|uniref:Nonribosomal peptide synthetase 12 n=1 Tax=Plenodomus tracheiphilus IPT5 TaxID=1408161 RepID=A0A6A7AZ53_9PLEO|nr:hypothetical protein T440DRAFT_520932 [Plenodomus tracheiphilus IPT5]
MAGLAPNNRSRHPSIEIVKLSLVKCAENEPSTERPSSRRLRADTFEPLDDQSPPSQCSRRQSRRLSLQGILQAPPATHTGASTQPDRDSNPLDPIRITESSPSETESQSTRSRRLVRAQRLQNVWLHWATAYRLIVAFTLAVNASVLVYVASRHRNSSNILIATSINLLVAVLVRQEDLINIAFHFVAKIPCTWPLPLRKAIADLHHYGGLHVGCTVSALFWYILFVVDGTINVVHHRNTSTMTSWLWGSLFTAYTFMVCLIAVCITAHPHLRTRCHNTFEHTHRFGGWFALLVLWINSGVASRSPDTPTSIYRTAPIYLLLLTTALIILPWLRIRRIPITATPISTREIKLTFPSANHPSTSTVKISRRPLSDWHAFATIPSPTSATATILISKAGDWTSNLITSPPTRLWLRNPPAQNFLALAPLFSSLLLVATGAGIGPVLSLLTSPAIRLMRTQRKLVKVMWTAYAPDAEHWAFVQERIRKVDAEPLVFDSRVARPDVAFEVGEVVRAWGVEAVMVVSNPRVTEEVVSRIKGQGGAAYGAVFDS